jgi:hypothetical protein
MPRHAILRHEHPEGVHWDLLLEFGAVLRAWALAEPPGEVAEGDARSLPDHRPLYLDYEGPISGGRGRVTRWDRGVYDLEAQSDDQWTVVLSGDVYTGRATLRRLPGEPGRWRVSWERFCHSRSKPEA